MKKVIALLLAVVLVIGLAACAPAGSAKTSAAATSKATSAATTAAATTAAAAATTAATSTQAATTAGQSTSSTPVDASKLKVGAIMVGDENEGYTYAHVLGINDMKKNLGLSDDQVIIKWNIGENEDCYDAAVDLAEQGCNIIFANSFGHESYILQAAKEYPNVEFCHATGYQAASSGLKNMHNFFTAVYQSRYVSGVVAGMKLAELYGADNNKKIGYVGSYSYAEVVSGYTAFFLGVRSVCPNVTMEVKYTGSWADQALEKETAEALIADGCVLIGQHADTTGAAAACESAKVYDVGYNVSMIDTAPNYALTSASIKWGPYYTYAATCAAKGESFPADWCQGHSDNAVWITDLNPKTIAKGTEAKVEETWKKIDSGELHVFDTSTFTVKGQKVTTTATDELKDTYHGVEYISPDGYFMESEKASAPSFQFRIDGITELNSKF